MRIIYWLTFGLLVMASVPLTGVEYLEQLGLGVHAGHMSSSGYSIRSFQDKLGIQGTIGAYATKNESSFNLGICGIAVLDEFERGRLYLIAGGSFRAFSDKEDDNEEHNRWTLGIGPGVELILGRNVRFTAELPITLNWQKYIVMWIPMAGLYYYFK